MSVLWLVLTLLPILGGAQRFNCRGRILGAYYADAKSGCKAFHVCVRVSGGGVRDFRFFCPPGTLFHQEAQTCTDWGDDDPLACPADIYDGQFDLYKIGSGFDTKKLSSPGNREEESEFGLQRAETGDRRLSQNNAASNNGASDLRTAHSSDFFSGQRERGREESVTLQAQTSLSPPARQSFRRIPTSRPSYPTTQFSTGSPSPSLQPSSPQYDGPKRKLYRKRPLYISTAAPTTTAQSYYSSPQTNSPQDYFIQKNPPQNKQLSTTTVNVPPEYKDEYVEVSRVTPKQSKYIPYNQPTTSTEAPANKKEGLIELYNYNDENFDSVTSQDNRPFKLRNSFNVFSEAKPTDFTKIKPYNQNYNRGTPGYSTNYPTTTVDYNSARGVITSTPSYRNLNSVSYEPEKDNSVFFTSGKHNYFNNPTAAPSTTTFLTTTRSDPYSNLNTYNTNNALNTQSSNYAEGHEDDGQYRLPQGEDDGQYRPELYERETELLSGAHSLNIAASGNRLPEDRKQEKIRSQKNFGKVSTPRPFRPASTTTTQQQPTELFTSTPRHYSEQTTVRSFDYYQPYTTTARPYDAPSTSSPQVNNVPKITTTIAPHKPELYSQGYEKIPSSSPRPRPSHNNRPNKEESSYDYAYYDSDPGFSEYDQIEEFGRTNSRV
ncbi:unnamed protein product [Pieris brassicae]|uniref:Chitin-binding type-2 domain-containing protein n=1 Tax=Pieris brassicae TaxID=7116 RepID=A0A9P0WTA1_PIEBR|nr:unnamed protein product [Pieris brassicae]